MVWGLFKVGLEFGFDDVSMRLHGHGQLQTCNVEKWIPVPDPLTARPKRLFLACDEHA